ncbi:hypothetical protein [Brevundimonas sp. GCM10030266]|uniref:hypothetical protein n=1 Tax=Brevundimonas sp. GCM10030266 TaxID=3273386 RepID=UPI003609B183
MLTTKGWVALGFAAALLAQTAGLMVQGRQLRHERAEVRRLEADLKASRNALTDALRTAARAEADGAVQAQEAAIVCQGEGAELFTRGRQVGIAIGRSQCPAS